MSTVIRITRNENRDKNRFLRSCFNESLRNELELLFFLVIIFSLWFNRSNIYRMDLTICILLCLLLNQTIPLVESLIHYSFEIYCFANCEKTFCEMGYYSSILSVKVKVVVFSSTYTGSNGRSWFSVPGTFSNLR